jgi:signal peptidase II
VKRRLFFFLFVLILLVADQVSKAIISQKVALMSSKSIISGFFNLTQVRNRGAIFGSFSQSGNQVVYWLLTLTSFAALALVIYFFVITPISEKFMIFSLSLILAGALGNLIDRIFRGYVIDFLDFYVKKWHWPAFNLADSCISLGAVFLVFIILFKRKAKCIPSSSS